MLTKLISILSILLLHASVFSQGHIEHIKNQEYMKLKAKVDCSNLPGDNLSERICANLAYQKSDSLLVDIYDSILSISKTSGIDSMEYKLRKIQADWRKMRDQHCGIIFDSFENCGSCHVRSIAYLNCLKELTDDRIKELRKLYFQLIGN